MAEVLTVVDGVLLGGLLAQTTAIIVLYYQVFRYLRAHERRWVAKTAGLTPLHVWSIGISYLGLSTLGFTPDAGPLRLAYYGAMLALGNFALATIMLAKRRQRLLLFDPLKAPRHR